MKSTGIVRKLDHLGRVVLPIELRKTLEIEAGTPLEIFVDRETIVLRKYDDRVTCALCGNSDNLKRFNSKAICGECRAKLRKEVL